MFKNQKEFISIYETPKGITYSRQSLKNPGGTLIDATYLETPGDMSFVDKIKDIPPAPNLGVVFTVRPEDYQLFQIKRPMVPETEMDNAILWVVQDKIFFPGDNYILSHFPCEKINPVEEIFVVAFKKSTLLENIEAIKKRFKCVLSLKIPELSAIGLLDYDDPRHDKFVLYLDSSSGKDMIYVVKNYALLKATLSPIKLDQEISETLLLTMTETLNMLCQEHAMKSDFEIHVSPALQQGQQWIAHLNKTLKGKVFPAKIAKMRQQNPALFLAIGGGLAYVKESL